MIGPMRTVPGKSPSAINRDAAQLPKNRVVMLGTPSAPGELAVTHLTAAGIRKGFGVIQETCDVGSCVAVHREGLHVLESDGTGAIAEGDLLVAVGTGSASTAGRVVALGGSPSAGEYLVVGQARTAASAVAGAEVLVEVCTPYLVKY